MAGDFDAYSQLNKFSAYITLTSQWTLQQAREPSPYSHVKLLPSMTKHFEWAGLGISTKCFIFVRAFEGKR